MEIREAALSEIAEIEQAKKGKIYSAGTVVMPIHGVSKDSFKLTQLTKPSEVSGRYVCILSKGLPPEYLFAVVEAAIDVFLSRYLQTINISFHDVGKMTVRVHTDTATQRLIASCLQALNQKIELTERKISEKKLMKQNLLGRMFP